MNGYGRVLVFSLVIAPFTLLRFGLVGPGETAMFALFVFVAIRGLLVRSGDFPFIRMWRWFIFCTLIGFGYKALAFGIDFSPFSMVLFDIASYVFILLSMWTVHSLLTQKRIDAYTIMKYIFLWGGLIISALYVVYMLTPSLFGLPLRGFDGRFVPLAINLHTVSVFTAPVAMVGFIVLRHERTRRIRLLTIALIAVLTLATVRTISFTATVGIAAGLGFVALNWVQRRVRINLWIIVAVGAMFVSLLYPDRITSLALDAILENENGRFDLYILAFELIGRSWLLGYGPGAHIAMSDWFWEPHNSILTIILQTGLVGLCVFAAGMVKVFKTIFRDPLAMAVCIPVMMYILSGTIMRRTVVWVLLVLLYHYVKQTDETIKS